MAVRCGSRLRPSVVKLLHRPVRRFHQSPSRCLITQQARPPAYPDFAFAFDIDGVLMRSASPLPRARESLIYLQKHRIPFILLTNGGGKHESERVAELSKRLNVELDIGLFIQSHTPFQDLLSSGPGRQSLSDKCVLVTGGDGDKCRQVAESYGFTNVIIPGDIITAHPEIWPFSQNFASYYASHARPLKKPIANLETQDLSKALKIDAIFVFNDPRDWALDTQLILDLLLSHKGYLGTVSKYNNHQEMPNRGYQQDGQPRLFFSNPDLHWAAAYHLPRLGQGGFREALEGVWKAVTESTLKKSMFGKPNTVTYAYAEKILERHREKLLAEDNQKPEKLWRVYMVGDNPQSDIRGAKSFESPQNTVWKSILVKSGVYTDGDPTLEPDAIVQDVWEAVQWGLENSAWTPPDEP